jgi:hypothetical protein
MRAAWLLLPLVAACAVGEIDEDPDSEGGVSIRDFTYVKSDAGYELRFALEIVDTVNTVRQIDSVRVEIAGHAETASSTRACTIGMGGKRVGDDAVMTSLLTFSTTEEAGTWIVAAPCSYETKERAVWSFPPSADLQSDRRGPLAITLRGIRRDGAPWEATARASEPQ